MIDPKLFMQIDMETPLKLSPKVFINREDENYFVIGLYDKENARKFLKHFLAVVYIFTDYQSPENLMGVWPMETFNDLLKVIISLKKDHVLLDQQQYEDVLKDLTVGSKTPEKDFNEDKAWLEPHLKAIELIPQGLNVLDFGAKGSGQLALEIARRGARKVVATSESIQNALYAQSRAKEENLTNIDFISCKGANLSSICYADKFDVFLTELYCPGIVEERILESVIYANKNLLSPDCIYLPSKMDLKVFAYDSGLHRDMVQESKEFEILYGLKFGSFTEAMSKHVMGIYTRLTEKEITRLSDDYTIKSFDFKTLQQNTFEETFEIEINKTGKLTGFCTFFELQLAERIVVSNSPFAPKNNIMQRIFTPAASLYPEVGDKFKLKALYDGTFRVLFDK